MDKKWFARLVFLLIASVSGVATSQSFVDAIGNALLFVSFYVLGASTEWIMSN